MSKTAILYIRVSTDEQADKGYSLRYQEERLTRYCELQGIRVISIYQEDYSAKTFDRPEFSKLLASLKKSRAVDLLLFTKWDRFSRNAADAYSMINQLNRLGVEPQALEQPLDLNVPENKIMLAFYLASPEVENDRRALNTFVAMRRAKKEGRWVSTAPKGYENVQDENEKKSIIPSQDAELIKWVFEELSKGVQTVADVLRLARKKGLKMSQSQFWRMLINPVYCGLIFIPAFKEEDDMIVKGNHEAIVSETTFYKIQDFLTGRKRNVPTKNTRRDELPLRGFLKCRKCGRNLTGSKSHGRTNKYFYYHCQPGCNERIPAIEANEEFSNLIGKINFNEVSIDMYRNAVERIFKENQGDKSHRSKEIKQEMDKLRQRLNKAQSLMLDGKLESDEYREIKRQTEPEIDRLVREHMQLGTGESEYKKYLDFGLSVFQNFGEIYKKGNVETKQALIGSIFFEKLVFGDLHYRTGKVNPAVELICPDIAGSSESEKSNVPPKAGHSLMVPETGIEPVQSQ